MELKTYQKKVISDLSTYMQLLNQTGKIDQAYRLFWNQKGLPVESGKIPPYQNILPGVPHLCLKVPTEAERPSSPVMRFVRFLMDFQIQKQKRLFGWCHLSLL